MFSGSLPSPQWCPSSSHSHFFRIAFFILAIYIYIYTYVHICLCVCFMCLLAGNPIANYHLDRFTFVFTVVEQPQCQDNQSKQFDAKLEICSI